MIKKIAAANTPESWLAELSSTRDANDIDLLKAAIQLGVSKDEALLREGWKIAIILSELELDTDTLIAALIYPVFQLHEVHHDLVAEKFGDRVKKILIDAVQMQSLEHLEPVSEHEKNQEENLRKIILAMVTDLRAVIIILAERLVKLHEIKNHSDAERRKLAEQSLKIHAPLANRLGIWQLKWEIEDLCLRYLDPAAYKAIASALSEKRVEREHYLAKTLQLITEMLNKQQLRNFKIHGRVKHIYSIYNKMKRKSVSMDKVYDICAMRVLVPEIEDCYTVVSHLHHAWQYVPEEFDDYIMQPKPNGYRSIHTVVKGPEDKYIEIQVRTFQMHDASELGVASHWRYKEERKESTVYEEKISLLRQIFAWQKEMATDAQPSNKMPVRDLFADRVYVFTPLGDIIDLPTGATPLDFAYTIHSEIGHRCRGAKVNGKLVPLTYQLKTGEKIDIQTTKTSHPSRDWLNPQKGYVTTMRARSHILHWFRLNEPHEKILPTHELQPAKTMAKKKVPKPTEGSGHAKIHVSNYLTKVSRCCNPSAGDKVIGYITQKQGLSIHKESCKNVQQLRKRNPQRFLEVKLH